MKKLTQLLVMLLALTILAGCTTPAVPQESTEPEETLESIPPQSVPQGAETPTEESTEPVAPPTQPAEPSAPPTEPPTQPTEPPATQPPGDGEALQYENMKAMWLSQFDLTAIYRSGSGQRDREDFTARMEKVLDNVADQGYNTVFLQVRPNADSMYPSEYYPMSSYVVGKTGGSAAYDPVEIIVELAHRRGLSIHAWINPMRGMTEAELKQVGQQFPMRQWYEDPALRGSYIVLLKDRWYLNPAYPAVRALITDGARELLERYDFDGLHMDDYFYPTTDASFDQAAYQSMGGKQSLADFRREQLSLLVSGLYSMTKQSGSGRIFGISPAGNVDTVYNSQYADVYRWCAEPGYLDYICPQVYFGLEHSNFGFTKVCRQFQDMIKLDSVDLIVGMTFGKALSREDAWAGSGKNEWKDNRDVLARCLMTTADLAKCRGISVFCYQYYFDPLTGIPVAETAQERENFHRVLTGIQWVEQAAQPVEPQPTQGKTPYLVKVSDPDLPIYSAPGGNKVGTVQVAATYTIVEERLLDGVLWGRLKSGAGWINLSRLESAPAQSLSVTAKLADENFLLHGAYYTLGDARSDYSVPIMLQTTQNVDEVDLYTLETTDRGFALGLHLGSLPQLQADTPLVVWIDFPGDMSGGALTVWQNGTAHYWMITLSGLDGSAVITEFTPKP